MRIDCIGAVFVALLAVGQQDKPWVPSAPQDSTGPRDLKPNPVQPPEEVATFQIGDIAVTEKIAPAAPTRDGTPRANLTLALDDGTGTPFTLDVSRLADPAYFDQAKKAVETPTAKRYRERIHQLEQVLDTPGHRRQITPEETRFLIHGMVLDFVAGDTNAPMRFADRWSQRGGYTPMQSPGDCYNTFAAAMASAQSRIMQCAYDASRLPFTSYYLLAPYQLSCMVEYSMIITASYGQFAKCAAVGSIPRVG